MMETLDVSHTKETQTLPIEEVAEQISTRDRKDEENDNLFTRWCARTSCHGVSDMTRARNWMERIFWITMVLASLFIISPQIYFLLRDYTDQGAWISVTYEVPKEELHLPDILLCNYNRINYTKAMEYHLTETQLLYISRQFRNPEYVFSAWEFGNSTRKEGAAQYKKWSARHNITFQNLMQPLAHDCEETIIFMVFDGRRVENPCKFVKIRESQQLGACLFIHPPEFLGKITKHGNSNGLKLVFDTNTIDYEPDFVSRYLDYGFAMHLSYNSYPNDWISLSSGFHHWISIRKDRTIINSNYRFSYLKFSWSKNDENAPCKENHKTPLKVVSEIRHKKSIDVNKFSLKNW